MRFRNRFTGAVLLTLALVAHCLPAAGKGRPSKQRAPAATVAAAQQQPSGARNVVTERDIEERDSGQNGITVSEPKVYDDALLQQMLRTAEARLAALQVIDQASILAKLGAVTGASQQTSSLGLNVQGAPVPGVVTTTKLPTESTKVTTAAGATSSAVETTSGLAVEDVQTTRSAFNPPPVTAPAPTTSMPSSFSVSASDILNEQMQLTAEINGLRLLLAGSLSDHFMKQRLSQRPDERDLPKLRTTLGFHVSLTPNEDVKDSVAVVEVEIDVRGVIERAVWAEAGEGELCAAVRKRCPAGDTRCAEEAAREAEARRLECIHGEIARRRAATGLPAVTALIPREKTYNVAAITDKSTSIGGGVATQIVGFSGSWVRGHKTYYLVQDQDTVALTYRPADGEKIGFRWQFRPVLGQRYVKAGLKQTFVQLAFPTLHEAQTGEIGRVAVRTYWRRYDRTAGVPEKLVRGSLREMYRDLEIPSFKQPVAPTAFDATQVEDIGGGQALVKLEGRFLPGTYVRLGSTILADGAGLKHEYHAIKFVAPIATLATRKAVLVAHNGEELELKFTSDTCAPLTIEGDPQITPVDDANSRVKVLVSPNEMALEETQPRLVFVIGQRVFGYSDAPLERELDASGKIVYLSAVVPNTLLAASPRLTVQTLFPFRRCTASKPLESFLSASRDLRLVVLEKGAQTKFLLYGDNQSGLEILSPANLRPQNIAPPGTPEVYVIELSPDHIKSNKYLLVRRKGGQPFNLPIPEVEVKKPDPPKARERVTVGSDEAVIDNVAFKELEGVTYRDARVSVEAVDDKSVRLKGLRTLGATSEAATRTFNLAFKSGAKAKVDLEVVTTKIETVPR